MRFLNLALLLSSSLVFSATEYEGQWYSNCQKEQHGYSRETIKIVGTNVDYSILIYGDAQCSNKYVDLVTTGTLDVGPLSQSIEMARETQTVMSKALMTPRSRFVVMMLNSKTMCGFKNWKVNVAKNISGLECDGQMMPKVGDSAYDLLSLTNKKLYYGEKTEENDGTTPEKRPKALDKNNPFSKN